MLRSVLTAIALAGVLAAAHPALADPVAFTVAGCAPRLALLTGNIFGGIGVRGRQEAWRDVPSFHAW